MKNQNKKGFTLVELVIVIAVIAVLAGVLIGTFATVISRANQSKAVQELKAAVDEAYVEYVAEAHKAPESIKITNGVVKFGDLNITGAEASDYIVLRPGSYVELDKEHHVYFNWTNESEYSVTTTGVGEDALVTVKIYTDMKTDFEKTDTPLADFNATEHPTATANSSYTYVGSYNNTTHKWTLIKDGYTYELDTQTGVWTVTK